MYDPKGHGTDRAVAEVDFVEAEPPGALSAVVHRVVSLRTTGTLAADYRFHALPDACVYLVFDQLAPQVAGVTRLRASSEELNLGRRFHFVNLRFLPGVWQHTRAEARYGLVQEPYCGDLPLLATNGQIIGLGFAAQKGVLFDLVERLLDQGSVAPNPVTAAIFGALDDIHAVTDMAEVAGLSARQLQRVLKGTLGFGPHDFLKVLRLQQSLKGEPSLSYADQSHFIHSFKRATGYTPGHYAKKFDV